MRGSILDYTGRPLADSRISYDIVIDPNVKDKHKAFSFLSGVLGIAVSDLESLYKRNFIAPFVPVTLVKDVDRKKAITIEENRLFYPNVYVYARPVRQYPYGVVFSHILGYVRNIDAKRLDVLREYGYRQRDVVGYQGIEEEYEPYLHGREGAMQVVVDNMGRPVKTISKVAPNPGTNVITTIDQDLQQIAYTHLKGRRGAVVFMDVETGAIRVMCSSPSYDNNIFVSKAKAKQIASVMLNPYAPLLNRAISAAYPPGSTFKVVTAAAGLDIGAISYDTEFVCRGALDYAGRRFGCSHVHGSQDIVRALAHSCNVFFYKSGLRLGIRGILPYAKEFGFGRKTGIDLPNEVSGLLPDERYKRKKFRQGWYDGDTLNLSIGQGFLLATPIQVVCAFNAIAAGGTWIRPYIVEYTGKAKAHIPFKRSLGLSDKDIKKIKQGLEGAVLLPDGTAHILDLDFVQVAGKTGTAQSVRNKPAHTWFAGYFPATMPKYSVVVMLEYGKSSFYACKLLKEILEDMHKAGLV